ncbi:3-keto-disaccharide hydrolase [Sphingobacterium sp. LRF_L2]|uniref:3-keto-disaccharide hydrolase n=1 Tax=Sphingobacterium sp. LRF_L2 TaxID=3369421 RepID=UPI003F61DA8D
MLALFFCLLTTSCKEKETVPNTLTDKEKNEGWQLLFDGKTLKNWHIYNQGEGPSSWLVKNGTLYCNPNSDAKKGDLVTNEEFENYELSFEWKLESEGNSGVFINVIERPDIDATYHSGPEYQLLEDTHPDFDKPLKRSGCLYTFSPQKNFVNTKSKGQWNLSRIIQKEGKVNFYLNGEETAEMDFKSQKWQQLVRSSNFKDYPEFGKHSSGKIALQDWSRGVSFQNIKIKKI